jgi:hypothetical protein
MCVDADVAWWFIVCSWKGKPFHFFDTRVTTGRMDVLTRTTHQDMTRELGRQNK